MLSSAICPPILVKSFFAPYPLPPSPVVRIGFEETLYTVREDEGTVEVDVAILSSILSSNVVVTLVTSDADAEGKLNSKGW